MKKKAERGVCQLLIVCTLLSVFAGCASNENITAPTTDTFGTTVVPSTTVTTLSPDPSANTTAPSRPTQPPQTEPDETEPTMTEPIPTQPEPTQTQLPETEPEPTEPKPTEPKPTEPEPTEPILSGHYTHSSGKTFQNMHFSYAPLPGAITVKDQYGYQSLGTMQLEDYPIDGVYDQSFNCIKVGDTYKMWWGRACPYDTIWYAESKDMKNWYNAQCVIDLKGYRTTWIKDMLLWSSVLYVNGQYHMFFEAPASLDEQGEYNNNICYAASKDGIHWTFYPDNENPKPVIYNPSTGRSYGVGQPKAFYKDGAFYIVYTDASDGGGRIRVAKSEGDPFHFGDVSGHPVIMSGVAGASVRYNETTGKYYMLISADVNTGAGNSMGIYIQESDDLYSWPYASVAKLKIKGGVLVSPEEITKKANPDFVTNDKGIVVGENMIFVYMIGQMPSLTEDHRKTHTTWDGCVGVLTVENANGKTAVLPNGKKATQKNLVWYQDRVAQWVRPAVTAVQGTAVIDGKKDKIYGSDQALLETVTWAGEDSKPSATTGTANMAWDQEALYLFINVDDKTLCTGAGLEENDSVTVFLSPFSADGGKVTADSCIVTVDAAGNCRAVDGEGTDLSDSLRGLEVKAVKTSDGYGVEMRIPWHGGIGSAVCQGGSIGMDICLTDQIGMIRKARVFWSDYAGSADSSLDRRGQLLLG